MAENSKWTVGLYKEKKIGNFKKCIHELNANILHIFLVIILIFQLQVKCYAFNYLEQGKFFFIKGIKNLS